MIFSKAGKNKSNLQLMHENKVGHDGLNLCFSLFVCLSIDVRLKVHFLDNLTDITADIMFLVNCVVVSPGTSDKKAIYQKSENYKY